MSSPLLKPENLTPAYPAQLSSNVSGMVLLPMPRNDVGYPLGDIGSVIGHSF
jgi:hypothetical protein